MMHYHEFLAPSPEINPEEAEAWVETWILGMKWKATATPVGDGKLYQCECMCLLPRVQGLLAVQLKDQLGKH